MSQYLTEIANWGQLNPPNLKYRFCPMFYLFVSTCKNAVKQNYYTELSSIFVHFCPFLFAIVCSTKQWCQKEQLQFLGRKLESKKCWIVTFHCIFIHHMSINVHANVQNTQAHQAIWRWIYCNLKMHSWLIEIFNSKLLHLLNA